MKKYRSFLENALRIWLLLIVLLAALGQVSLNKGNPAEESLCPPSFRFHCPALAGWRFSAGGKPANLLYVAGGLYLLAWAAGSRLRPRPSPIILGAALLAAASTVAWLLSPVPTLSWKTGLAPLLVNLGIFYLVASAFARKSWRKALLAVFAAGLSLDSLAGLLLYARGTFFPQTAQRIWLSFGHPNSTGAVLVLTIPVALALVLSPRPAKRKTIPGLTATLCLIVLFLTFSRTAWLSLLGGLGLLAWLLLRPRSRAILVAAAALLGLLLVWGVNVGPQNYWKERVKTFTSLGKDPNVQKRLIYWDAAWRMIQARPVFGCGPGYEVFVEAYQRRFKRVDTGEPVTAPHNGYLSLGVGTGLIGLTSFFFLLGSTLFILLRRRRKLAGFERALAAGATASLIGFLIGNIADDPLLNERVAAVFWLLLGLIAAPVAIDAEDEDAYNTLSREKREEADV